MQRHDDILPLLDDVLPMGAGHLVMLKAYLDRGALEKAGGVMAVAVAVFKPTPYKRFCRDWRKWLGPLPYFHATDFYGGWDIYSHLDKDTRNAMAAQLPAIIDTHLMQIMCVSFLEDEYRAVVPPNWRGRFGSSHRIAVQLCLDVLGHHFDKIRVHEPIAYFIESGDDTTSEIDSLFKRIANIPDRRKHWRYFSHTFVKDKGAARGIEVADAFAWHWDKFYAETLVESKRAMRKDLQALIAKHPRKYQMFPFHGEALAHLLLEHGCTRPGVTPVNQASDDAFSLPPDHAQASEPQ